MWFLDPKRGAQERPHIYLSAKTTGFGAHESVHAGAGQGWDKAGGFLVGLRLDDFPFETRKPMGPLQCRPRAARDTSLSGCSGSVVQWHDEHLLHVASGPVRSVCCVASGHEKNMSFSDLSGRYQPTSIQCGQRTFNQKPTGVQ